MWHLSQVSEGMEFLLLTNFKCVLDLTSLFLWKFASLAVHFSYQWNIPLYTFSLQHAQLSLFTKKKFNKNYNIYSDQAASQIWTPSALLLRVFYLLFPLRPICRASSWMLALHHVSAAYQFNLIFLNAIWTRPFLKQF